MDTNQHLAAPHNAVSTPVRFVARFLLVGLVAVAVSGTDVDTPITASASDDQRVGVSVPDLLADHAGGIAARLYDADGEPLAGDLFLLIGSGGATPNARVYDSTPYTHDRPRHPDTVASNLLAARTVERITGADVDVITMTSASAGGHSGGLTRAIAYLNVMSEGGFTGDLRVAATGVLSPAGLVSSIDGIDAKAAAANLAGADVLFTPTVPTSSTIDAYGARLVGELVRDPDTGSSFHDPRRIEQFRRWGAHRPSGMDVIDARHIIDVSSYLCGAGSTFACDVTEQLGRQAQERLETLAEDAGNESARLRSISQQSG